MPGYSLKRQGRGGVLAGRADGSLDNADGECEITAPATDEAKQWEGWSTTLKPAWEPIIVARKPLIGTIVKNVLKHGTGGLNIDGTRIATDGRLLRIKRRNNVPGNSLSGSVDASLNGSKAVGTTSQGRWPANLIHDGSEDVRGNFPDSAGAQGDVRGSEPSRVGDENTHCYGKYNDRVAQSSRKDSGSAARFFYCAKASKSERGKDNKHPTVKPLALMRWLVRLVTPPGGVVMDNFMGSGSTLVAAKLEGFRAIGIEMKREYCETAVRRLTALDKPKKKKSK